MVVEVRDDVVPDRPAWVAEVVARAERDEIATLDAEQAEPVLEPRELVQVEPEHRDGVAECVRARGRP